MSNPRPNPYVGPRSFRTGETMYGRECETLELLDLIIAERIVLLYSPSGAGKTSLIQAALLPKLREEGFNVLPTMRVSAEPPPLSPPPGSRPGGQVTTALNRFVLSTLLSLEEKLPQDKRLPISTLARMTFDSYLQQRAELADSSPVLIFDQFEEILTLDPTNLAAKTAFFEQIGNALRDRERWALFSMREDYFAGLDPYLKSIPTRLATTYRLDLLGINAAREAIQKPPRNSGVDFTDAAATKLVNDLRQVQVQRPDGSMELQPGPYVEPVQLQVVCFRLWDKLPAAQNSIQEKDIADVGDVNTALAGFYATTVSNVATASGVSERKVREWVDRQLITEQGIRGQVLMEREASRGLSNQAIRLLEDAHLVRADERRGATWFELAHDRLIEPVRRDNAVWFSEHLLEFQQNAVDWDRRGRPDGLLLAAAQLQEANKWSKIHAAELTANEHEFLQASNEAQATREREARQNRRIRFLAIGATILSALALVAFVVALAQFGAANASAQDARNAQATAVANEQEAHRQRQEVITQDRVSKMVSASLSQLEVDPEVSLLLAAEAYSTTQDVQTDDALRQALIASRLRDTLEGHTAQVLNASVSRDGARIASGGADGTARVWDIQGNLLATLSGLGGTVWSAVFNSAGNLLATTDDDGVRLWDANCLGAGDNQACLLSKLQGHTGRVYSAAFSPDDSQLVTAGQDQTAIVWNTVTGEQERVLRGHKSIVNSAQYSPDGSKIVTASADQTLRVWDLANCAPECAFREFTGPAGSIWNASFSPDGKSVIAASDDQNAYKFDLETGNVVTYLVGHTDSVFGAVFTPDGRRVVTASADGTARLWDAEYGTLLAIFRGHSGNVNSVAITPGGDLIVTSSDDGTIKLWNEYSGAELTTVRGHDSKIFSIAYSADGKRIVTSSQDRSAGVWDPTTGQELWAPLYGAHDGWVLDANFNPDATRVVTASDDGTVRVWQLEGCSAADGLCPSPPFVLGNGAIPEHAVFSPDGTRILIAGSDGKLRLLDATGLSELPFVETNFGNLTSAVYNADGSRIVTAGVDGTAHVLDAANGSDLLTLRGHAGALTSAAFSADGNWIVTGSEDRTARVWDAATGVEKFTLRGHNGSVSAVAFNPDGSLIVTASADKTARLWDAASGEQVSILRGHTDGLTGAAFSPDGKFVATSSADRTARITLTLIKDIFDLARTRFTRELSCDEWRAYLQEDGYCPSTGALPVSATAQATQVAVQPTGGASQPTQGAAQATTAPRPTDISLPSPTPFPASPTPETIATVLPTAPPEATDTAEPTIQATAELATAEPTSQALPTQVVQATPTFAVPPTAPATATPQAPPGVYATNIRSRVLDPNARPTQIVFTVSFFNNTGQPANFTRWRVLIYRQGENKSFGDTPGLERSIADGISTQDTQPWNINVAQCENFFAIPIWENNEGARTPFLAPDGSQVSTPVQVCP